MALTKVTTGTIADDSIQSLKNRNLIINGAMQVAQRGTSTTTINQYLIDRWRSYGGPLTHTFSQVDDISTYPVTRYALRIQRDSGETLTNGIGAATGLESIDSYPLAGQTVTLSFKARCGANFSPTSNILRSFISTGTGTDQSPVSMTGTVNHSQDNTLTTSVQTFTQTATISSSTTQVSLRFEITPTGTAGADDWFEVTEVQLELGSTATPFEHETFGETLAKCQRYYQELNIPTDYTSSSSASVLYRSYTLPTTMRANSATAVVTQLRYWSGSGGANFTPTLYGFVDRVRVDGTGLTNGRGFLDGKISMDAEL